VRWQRETEETVVKTRKLTTPFGRIRKFYGRRFRDYQTGQLDPTFVDEALNYVPQSTVADVVNEAWLRLLDSKEKFIGRVIQQCHDSLLLQTPIGDLDETIAQIDKAFDSVVFEISGRKCCIPHDVQVGANWRDMKKR
jgi:DNA polymerase I-like protein with 3'-5' exonuclease and polymerase domains